MHRLFGPVPLIIGSLVAIGLALPVLEEHVFEGNPTWVRDSVGAIFLALIVAGVVWLKRRPEKPRRRRRVSPHPRIHGSSTDRDFLHFYPHYHTLDDEMYNPDPEGRRSLSYSIGPRQKSTENLLDLEIRWEGRQYTGEYVRNDLERRFFAAERLVISNQSSETLNLSLHLAFRGKLFSSMDDLPSGLQDEILALRIEGNNRPLYWKSQGLRPVEYWPAQIAEHIPVGAPMLAESLTLEGGESQAGFIVFDFVWSQIAELFQPWIPPEAAEAWLEVSRIWAKNATPWGEDSRPDSGQRAGG